MEMKMTEVSAENRPGKSAVIEQWIRKVRQHSFVAILKSTATDATGR
ncbi:hypothetical protein MA5S0422_3019 [Mycobacteroides abscessus 5S-0422]|uniref:Uncharacterized protein n=1 Tax=Mycobacteroides abscessus subsp. bolletii 1513 TaxID=1299321 RepID=X8DTR2_9MYCO|nr:hypothetical protein MA5S0422_3019 [Mycobacteroides abscessus 5S-0422]EIU20766.1 hypothetical protein MA5S0708_5108 [Mycobacteroides abscessus 5S-0708]EUA71749.1 hypothetical protein I540_3253 [Mycobacteroides abscessus subsp. bolletii 1513]